jgi:hypothetical protein
MMQTLYKTATPTTFEDGEFYQVRLDFEFVQGAHTYFVRETHGWWNDQQKRLVHHLATLDPQEGYATFQEADQAYAKQVKFRASEGFKHSFQIDPFSGVTHQIVDPPA